MAKAGAKKVAIELNQEEFEAGFENKQDIRNCIGALMLRKAFPTAKDVHFGRWSGWATGIIRSHRYHIEDEQGNEVDILAETTPRLLYVVADGKAEKPKYLNFN